MTTTATYHVEVSKDYKLAFRTEKLPTMEAVKPVYTLLRDTFPQHQVEVIMAEQKLWDVTGEVKKDLVRDQIQALREAEQAS